MIAYDSLSLQSNKNLQKKSFIKIAARYVWNNKATITQCVQREFEDTFRKKIIFSVVFNQPVSAALLVRSSHELY